MSKKRKLKYDETSHDLDMALELERRNNILGLTENAIFTEHMNQEVYWPKTLIDQTLENIDPTPNIYTLFGQFDARFFSSKLVSVEVKWSERMTSCAGTCTFRPRSRDCVITLSAPLLKLRPRKDLVETLLHEMIHAYLFLTNNNRDRSGHGPEFCKIMRSINDEAGTRITIYHSFHDEVRLYQQHWWRCDGPCQNQAPFFGTVRRAMNRAPGPSDFWWERHRQMCNGRFIKVREPEKKVSRSKVLGDENARPKGKKEAASAKRDINLIDRWIGGKSNGKSGPLALTDGTTVRSTVPKSSIETGTKVKNNQPTGLVKLGTSTNNVHGWGTGGPGSSSAASPNSRISKTPDRAAPRQKFNFSGTLGGVGTGRSNILDKYSFSKKNDRESKCPDRSRAFHTIEESSVSKKPKIIESSKRDDSKINRETYDCPVCDSSIRKDRLNDHLDACLAGSSATNSTVEEETSVIEIPDSLTPEKYQTTGKVGECSTPLKGQTNLDSFVVSSKKKAENLVSCPICDKVVSIVALYDHMDACPSAAVTDDGNREDANSKLIGKAADRTNRAEVCLVCNAKINGDVALTDHLEECIRAIFNDDVFDVGNDSIKEISSHPDKRGADNKYPCPVCMDFVQENFMNDHLDNCLSSN